MLEEPCGEVEEEGQARHSRLSVVYELGEQAVQEGTDWSARGWV